MKFSRLQLQETFRARGKIYRKVFENLGADVTVEGDSCTDFFGSEDEVEPVEWPPPRKKIKPGSALDVPTENEINGMNRAELDELAAKQGVDLENRNVSDSRKMLLEILIPAPETEEPISPDSPTEEEIRQMKRAELDDLAAKHNINLEGFNVEDSRELLVDTLIKN